MTKTLTEILNERRIEIATSDNLHYRTGWTNIRCPFCASVKFLLGIRPTYATCYNCGPKRIYDILVTVGGLSKRDAFQYTQDHRDDDRGTEVYVPTGKYEPPEPRIRLTKSKPHVRYCKERRLDPEFLEDVWKVEAITFPAGIYSWRLFIPILHNGEPISWTTRSIAKETKYRYLTSPPERERLPAKSVLFGEDFVGDSLVVHEGPIDALTTGPGASATLGLGYTSTQLARMTKYERRYICFDNDRAAQRRARKLMTELTPYPGETYNITLSAKDANHASEKERQELRRLAFG